MLHDPEHRRERRHRRCGRCWRATGAARAVRAVPGAAGWADGLPAGRVDVPGAAGRRPGRRRPRSGSTCWTLDLTTTADAAAARSTSRCCACSPTPARPAPGLVDGLWLRLVRLDEALAARRYAAPVDLVLEVTDTRCPWNAGRWRLAGDETGATCARSSDPADLRLDTTALAAAYLGDPVLAGYAAAGRIVERAARRAAPAGRRAGLDPRPLVPAPLLTRRADLGGAAEDVATPDGGNAKDMTMPGPEEPTLPNRTAEPEPPTRRLGAGPGCCAARWPTPARCAPRPTGGCGWPGSSPWSARSCPWSPCPTQIYQLTGSSAWVGLTGLFGLVPLIVFGLWGGAIADAVDRRVLLLVTGAGIAVSSLALWVTATSGIGGVWIGPGAVRRADRRSWRSTSRPAARCCPGCCPPTSCPRRTR